MKRLLTGSLHIVVLFFIAANFVGCTKIPVYENKVIDDRPMISFTVRDGQSALNYTVIVDGLVRGNAAEFVAGKAGLRVTSGTHTLQINKGSQEVYKRQIYLGDGSTKEVQLP